jgi:hypothetical protein
MVIFIIQPVVILSSQQSKLELIFCDKIILSTTFINELEDCTLSFEDL